MDTTNINWILVIWSKCDTVMQSYEPGSATNTAVTLFCSKYATYLAILCNKHVCVEIFFRMTIFDISKRSL